MNDAHNPYTPPKAEVSSGPESYATVSAARPATVNIALFLLGVEILLSITGSISELTRGTWNVAPARILFLGAIDIGVTLLLCVFVARGRNWARIVYLVLWILSLAGLLLGLYMAFFGVLPAATTFDTSWKNVLWLATPHLLSLTIVVLLFGPGRSWFRRRISG